MAKYSHRYESGIIVIEVIKTTFWLDLRATLKDGIHVWNFKSSQEPTNIILLNGIKLSFKHISLYP